MWDFASTEKEGVIAKSGSEFTIGGKAKSGQGVSLATTVPV